MATTTKKSGAKSEMTLTGSLVRPMETTKQPKPSSEGSRKITVVSDGTGETALQMVKAALVQFGDHETQFSRYKNIRSEAQIDAVFDEVGSDGELLIFTLVSPHLRTYLLNKAKTVSVPCIDLLGPLLGGLSRYLGHEPKMVAGLLHDVNDRYFDRIEAMEYTIAHDDGRDLTDLDQADLIILGISRTSKTPLSMFLSHQGWKIANIPLIKGFDLPKEISTLDPKRIIGLTIDPDDLATIRRNRLVRLGQDKGGDYADPARVQEEIEYANEIFRRNRRWPLFNVTGKALEETASEIVKLMTSRKLTPTQR